MGIVYRAIATYLIKKAGYNKKTARTGAVTLIQRFGSALNLNIHFHMLFLDGVYVDDASEESHPIFDAAQGLDLRQMSKKQVVSV